MNLQRNLNESSNTVSKWNGFISLVFNSMRIDSIVSSFENQPVSQSLSNFFLLFYNHQTTQRRSTTFVLYLEQENEQIWTLLDSTKWFALLIFHVLRIIVISCRHYFPFCQLHFNPFESCVAPLIDCTHTTTTTKMKPNYESNNKLTHCISNAMWSQIMKIGAKKGTKSAHRLH